MDFMVLGLQGNSRVGGVGSVGGWGRSLTPHTPQTPQTPHTPLLPLPTLCMRNPGLVELTFTFFPYNLQRS